ncbi:MAG: hypothetical protein LBH68_05285 [Bifidobacteriaceae bacterium]|nr:hypothetical protein [Bifidobacteriaceae bacterium]
MSSSDIRSDARELKRQGYTEQAAMLEDGEITAEEYQEAFDLFRSCLEEVGEGIAAGPYVNPLDGLTYEFMIDPGNVVDPIEQGKNEIACEDRYFDPLDYDYGHSHEPQMDPVLHEALRECLADKGFETSGEEKSVRDFVGGDAAEVGSDLDNAVTECIRSEVERLYPDREVVGGYGW